MAEPHKTPPPSHTPPPKATHSAKGKGEIKPGAMPWKNRYIGNPILTGVLNILFRTRISDAHCGLRALTADCFRRLRLSGVGME